MVGEWIAILLALSYKLLEYWNLNVRMEIILLDHVTWEEVDNFTVSHPLVVEGVNLLEQKVDVLFTFDHTHSLNQVIEILFIDDTISVSVNTLVQICEFLEELLVLQ